ncbi:DUF3710 domain-containing protein [Actinophytocola gossypii]|uniref:DUF3710 domain-containing protein n=1 Tax=Actinophytocola gossypii TaxID=2812003 RepID=A0ABT2J804_9PSEU|nr:DUF3710 domain-containing protein [Actinophytocola gossypii]MCT2583980.1 DUF3710 domain-containing protein [Actinophytocola gossypii]
MGLFGRRKRDLDDEEPGFADDYDGDAEYGELGGEVGGDLFDDAGPYDTEDAPADGVPRLDFGAVRLPVTPCVGFRLTPGNGLEPVRGSRFAAKMSQDGAVASELNFATELCLVTLSAYAAPRSGELWREEWCGELADNMRAKGTKVQSTAGAWGQELLATYPGEVWRFVGVDGPRWLLRAAVCSAPDRVDNAAAALYELMRGTVVVRGTTPMPVGMPLPLTLPPPVLAYVQAQARARAQALANEQARAAQG